MVWGDAQPIQTRYKGYHFRSRLEARWAVFMDALGLTWEYEPQGFDLDGVWYLPDFWLPFDRLWLEVKPFLETYEQSLDSHQKALLLVAHTGQRAVQLKGGLDPIQAEEGGAHLIYRPDGEGGSDWRGGVQWATCLECGRVSICDGSGHNPMPCGHHAIGSTPELEAAYVNARSARFERGR